MIIEPKRIIYATVSPARQDAGRQGVLIGDTSGRSSTLSPLRSSAVHAKNDAFIRSIGIFDPSATERYALRRGVCDAVSLNDGRRVVQSMMRWGQRWDRVIPVGDPFQSKRSLGGKSVDEMAERRVPDFGHAE